MQYVNFTTHRAVGFRMALAVATTDEIPPGERKFFDIDGTEIAVINLEGEYYAIRNSCPHMEGPIGRGPMFSEGGEARIACPFHGWEFDLDSGKALFESKRLQTYDVTVEDDEVVVDV
jgi:nitrite reductase (NADH) small subunit